MTPVEAAARFISASPSNARLLVAVSGGSDSTGLLLALHEAKHSLKRLDISLFAATIDHALRLGSDVEATKVGNICRTLHIPHHIAIWSDEKPRTGVPAAARLARYRLLSSIAHELSATCVVTGHTWNDQIETIAMREGRSGVGSVGLSGMADAMLFNRKTWVVRPFLSVAREDIRNYLLERKMGWIDDPTNINDVFERARVRKTLAVSPPVLAEPEAALAKRSENSDAVAAFLSRHAVVHDQSIAAVERGKYTADSIGLRTLAILIAVMGGKSHVPGREAMAKLEQALQSAASTTLTLSRSVITIRRDAIYITREIRDLPDLTLKQDQTGQWDNRFLIRNVGRHTIKVSGHVADKGYRPGNKDTIPKSVANRASATQPGFTKCTDGLGSAVGLDDDASQLQHTVEPFFPLFDLFLPIVDLPVANCVSKLFGRSGFPPFPVHYM